MEVKNAQMGGQAAQAQSNSTASGKSAKGKGGTNFLENFRPLPQSKFRTTPSGLRVAVIKEGQGPGLANGMRLKVQYSGWLDSGKRFDTSLKRNTPFEFTLGAGQVIKGWEEGMAGIKAGERRQLIIPAELAYGQREVGEIPPGSTLIFNVEAVAVENANANPNGNRSIVA